MTTSTSAELAAPPDELIAADQLLREVLYAKNSERPTPYSESTGLTCMNQEIADDWISEEYVADGIKAMEDRLKEEGTLDIPVITGKTVVVDGVEKEVSIVAATDTSSPHGEMATKLYLRDQIQAASALLELSSCKPERYGNMKTEGSDGAQGRTLLISALDLMSTAKQLERMDKIIAGGNKGQGDWPHILFDFNDLNAKLPNGWRNIQDTLPMLADLAFDSLKRGIITTQDLGPAHKHFLGSVMPFLKAVGFPRYENSGSWEEVAAIRTSVMGIETAMLHKVQQLTLNDKNGRFNFLRTQFDIAKQHVTELVDTNFDDALEGMIDNGLREIGKRIPYESPDETVPIRQRHADASLVYLLMYGIPQLLAERQIPIGKSGMILSAEEIEFTILAEIATLFDEETHGIHRYGNPENPDENPDSYEGLDFNTAAKQLAIRAFKKRGKEEAAAQGHTEIDLDVKQQRRDLLIGGERPAAWTHPLGQIAGWAAKRSLELRETSPEMADLYLQTSTHFLNYMLSTITGEGQWYAVMDGRGGFETKEVAAWRLPECYVAYRLSKKDGEQVDFVVPSPHTPLNWSAATLRLALGLQIAAREHSETFDLAA